MSSFKLGTWGDERAKEDDRRFFVANFGRRFRIRDLLPFEINGAVERAPGITRRVIVARISPNLRMRVLVRAVLFDENGKVVDYEDNDDALLVAFEENASPSRLAEYRAACAKIGRRS